MVLDEIMDDDGTLKGGMQIPMRANVGDPIDTKRIVLYTPDSTFFSTNFVNGICAFPDLREQDNQLGAYVSVSNAFLRRLLEEKAPEFILFRPREEDEHYKETSPFVFGHGTTLDNYNAIGSDLKARAPRSSSTYALKRVSDEKMAQAYSLVRDNLLAIAEVNKRFFDN